MAAARNTLARGGVKKRTSTGIFAVGDEVSIADLSMPMSAVGTSRHFAAPQDLVAIGA
jgi:hypothetical protein